MSEENQIPPEEQGEENQVPPEEQGEEEGGQSRTWLIVAGVVSGSISGSLSSLPARWLTLSRACFNDDMRSVGPSSSSSL